MAKITYNNANVVANYDTFAGWLTKTNMIMYDMGNFVLTTSTTSSPDITTGNAFVNGFFGSNTVYVTTAIQGGTPNTAANLAISSGLTVAGQAWLSSNVNITGSANVATVLNVTGNTNIANLYSAATINAANLVSNNTITANTLNSLVKITAPVANVTTANIGTLGVTGSTTLANLNIGTSAAANLQANASTITFAANTAANGSINATSYTGTAANATLFAGLQLANLQAQITGNAATSYTNAVTFAANASNLGSGTVPNGRLSAQVVNTSGNFTIAGVVNHTANLVITGNATAALVVGNNTSTNVFANATNFLVRANSVIGSVSVNTTAISVGNATVYTTINTTAFSGTANNANSLGGSSLSTIQDQISGNAATAYTNAAAFAANASNLGSGTVPNGRLSAQVVNTSGNFTIAGVVNHTANLVITGNATAALVVGNNTSTNVFANATNFLVRANSVIGSVSVNTTAISVGNATVYTTINTTAFSGTANNANSLGGSSLSTIQDQISGNAATAYTNAAAFAANASNLGNGTVPNGRLSGQVVNTSGDFTIAGVVNHTANLVVTGSATSALVVGNNTSTNVFANSTSLLVRANSVIGSVSINTTAISVGNATVSTTINTTAFSGTAANATLFAGQSLSTIETRITGNASAAYTNATAYVTAGGYTVTGNVGLGGNATSQLLISTISNTSPGITANSTQITLATNTTVSSLINATSFTGTAANATLFGGHSVSTVQDWISTNVAAVSSAATTAAATAYTNAVADAATDASTKAGTAYTNATAFAANASNLGNGTVPNARLSGQVVNTSGNFTMAGVINYTANVVITGGGTSRLTIGNNVTTNLVANSTTLTLQSNSVVGSVFANTTIIRVGNGTVYTTVNTTAFSGDANNASYLGGVAAADYQTEAGLSANVAVLTANAAGYLGNSSGTYANILSQISSSANAAYSNALSFVSASLGNGSYVAANATYSANAGAVAGVEVNASSPSDGYVLAYDSGQAKIVFKNPSNISVALNSNTVVANSQLQAGSNGSAYAVEVFSNATASSIALRANTISMTVDSGFINLNSVVKFSTNVYSGNSTANVFINSSSLYIYGNAATYAYINSTAFSGTANNATYLNGLTLSTIQAQITGNAATAYTNAVSNAAAIYQTKDGLSSNVAELTANAAGYLGNSSGTYANILSQISSSANTAFSNAIANAAASASALYFPKAGGSISGDVTISGNLNVTGTTVYANVTNLDVKDLNITVAKGAASNVASDGAGITVDIPNAQFFYSGSANTWNINRSLTPGSNTTFALGSTTMYWNNVFTTALNFSGAASINATTYTGTANNATNLGGATLSTIQSQITGNASAAYTNATSYVTAGGYTITNTVTHNANVVMAPNTTILLNSNTSNSPTISIGNVVNMNTTSISVRSAAASSTNTSIDSLNYSAFTTIAPNVFGIGTFGSTGGQLKTYASNSVANVSANTLAINSSSFTLSTNVVSGANASIGGNTFYINTTALVFSNGSSNIAFVNAANYTGTANNASYLGGTAASGYQTTAGLSANVAVLTANAAGYLGNSSGTFANIVSQISTAYSNAVSTAASDASTKAGTAYTNAVSTAATDASTKAGTAYTNAVSTAATDASTKAGTAYTNAVSTAASDASTKAGTAYSNAVSTAASDASSKAGNAYSNAVATAASDASSKAGNAYSNAVAAAASDASTKAGTAYTNAVSTAATDASTKAGTAYSNAVATAATDASTKAETAYSNAVATAAADASTKAGTAFSNAIANAAASAASLYFPKAGGSISGDVTISGNLNVTGTTFYANVTNLDVKDLNITVAKGAASNAASDGAGITVDVPNAQILYNAAANSWYLNRSTTPSTNNSLNLGSATQVWSTAFVTNVQATDIYGTIKTTSQPNITANNSTNFGGQPASYYTNATNLTTGTVAPARLGTGTANDTTVLYGNGVWAAVPTSSFSNGTAYTWSALQTFNANVSLTGNATSQIVVGSATINATTYSGTANNATNFGGQPASYYTNATNLSTGTVPTARLATGTANSTTALFGNGVWASAVSNGTAYTWSAIQTFNANVSLTGNATSQIVIGSATINATTYSGTSNNATNFGGQPASYYTNATNLSTGTVAAARLATGTANSSTVLFGNGVWASAFSNGTAYTWSAIQTFNANVSLSGNSTSQIVVGSTTINATTYSGTANNATNFGGQPASYYTNATNLSTGTVAAARLGTGTADNTTVLYGNGVWATIPTQFSNGTAYTWSAVQTFNANVSIAGNATSQMLVGNTTANVVSNTTGMTFGNSAITGFLGIIKSQTGTAYTFANSDSGAIVEFSNSSATTVTLPNSAPVGFNVLAVQIGTGNVTFTAAAGASIVKRATGANTGGRYAGATLYVRSNPGGAAVWWLGGDVV